MALGIRSGLRLPLAVAAAPQELYALASQGGHGRSDFSAVFKVIERAPADA